MLPSTVRRRRRRRRATVLAALIAAGSFALGACASSTGRPNAGGPGRYGAPAPTPPNGPDVVASNAALAIRRTPLGTILTNGQGFALYAFEADTAHKSACSDACATAWPPVTASSLPPVGPRVRRSLMGEITRADGTTQLTYAGHPLYLFSGDGAPGNINGQGLTAFGARWDVLTPTGRVVTRSE